MTYIPDYYEANAADEEEPGDEPIVTAEVFLRDLAEKLRHLPPAAIGTDDYHSSRLYAIAESIENSRKA